MIIIINEIKDYYRIVKEKGRHYYHLKILQLLQS